MPKLGLTMEEGTIVQWLVEDGAEIVAGTPVLLIETDKVETEVEANGGGRLRHAGVAGETFACGAVIGWFMAEGEDPSAARAAAPAAVYAAESVASESATAAPP